MIGDLILWMKKVWKQQTCVHDYKIHYDKTGLGRFDHYECDKCDKWKWQFFIVYNVEYISLYLYGLYILLGVVD